MTHNLIKRIIEIAFNAAAAVAIVIDAVARPVYRPIIAWANHVEFFRNLEVRIAGLPRLAVLALFAVPFAIAEPAKVVALLWIAEGSVLSGFFLLGLSYLATFLLVERIYHAGRHKLLTYAWFAWAIMRLSALKQKMASARTRVLGFVSSLIRR
ncbi:hypothetical protein G6L37_01510 [Agrobacterium rubi]|nr:hypothetical protein [Agrobacterium rubi]NTF24070.1 hypothetical protein [Agrobacterium rubi]